MQRIARSAVRVAGRRSIVTTVEDASHFDKLVAENPKCIVQFTASWCGPCKVIAPAFLKMSDATEGVAFLKVDVDECSDVAGDYSVTSIPHFVALRSGSKFDALSGANAQVCL